jgi:hypothetical protein
MRPTSAKVLPEQLERFFSMAKAVRDKQTSVCPILDRLAFCRSTDLIFNLHPEVVRIQEATDNDPLRVALACLATASTGRKPQGIMFQVAEYAQTEKDLQVFPFHARRKFVRAIYHDTNSFDKWWRAFPYREKGFGGFNGAGIFLCQWALAAPLGPCRDAEDFFRTWPESRYGLGWLEGNTSGKYWLPGNTKPCRDIIKFILEVQHDPGYDQYNEDFNWTGPAVPIFADLFGRHSFELMLSENVCTG